MAENVKSGPLASHGPLWIAIALALVTLAVYCPVTGFQFVNFDDPDFIAANPHVQAGLTLEGFKWAWSSVLIGNWHPITMLTLMLDCQLFGAKPWWPHLVNALLHAANAVLLFALFKRMTGAMWRSAAVAALFALHPLHVESVAWVSERKDVLSTLFWLLTIWAYIRYTHKVSGQWSVVKVYYGLSLVFFALGLMSKPMVVTAPFTLLLLDYWPLGRLKGWAGAWRLVWEKIPFFALSAAVCVATFRVEKQSGGMLGLQYFPPVSRVGNALVSYVRYIEKMFWPRHLAGFYPVRPSPWPWWVVALAALLLLAVSVLVVAERRRRPYLGMGWFWYLGTLVPVIGLVQVSSQCMADRFTYVPLIGLFAMLAWGGWELAGTWRLARFAPAAMAVALATCAAATVRQEFFWKDGETFNKRMIEVMPDNSFARNNLGCYYLDVQRTNEALAQFRAAVELDPTYAEARHNLATSLAGRGQFEEATSQYLEAIRLKPEFAEARNNLGIIYILENRTNEALDQFMAAVQANPHLPTNRYNLGKLCFKLDREDEAVSNLMAAVKEQPDYPDAHNYLGRIFLRQKRYDEALEHYRAAAQLQPDYNDYFSLANALGQAASARGDAHGLEESALVFEQALRLKPESSNARQNAGVAWQAMGMLCASQNRMPEAERAFRELVRLQPGNTDASRWLSDAVAAQKGLKAPESATNGPPGGGR